MEHFLVSREGTSYSKSYHCQMKYKTNCVIPQVWFFYGFW
jgi:hypothetical protein